jgi:hypothetical protein
VKLKYHAAEAGGVQKCGELPVVVKLKYHAAEAGGVQKCGELPVVVKLKYHAAEAGGVQKCGELPVAVKLNYHAAEAGGVGWSQCEPLSTGDADAPIARMRLRCSASDIFCRVEWISSTTSLSLCNSCGEFSFAKIAAAISLLSSLEMAMIQESIEPARGIF